MISVVQNQQGSTHELVMTEYQKGQAQPVVCSIVKAMFPSSVTPLLACCANPEDQILE
jgi:hypothetical protein